MFFFIFGKKNRNMKKTATLLLILLIHFSSYSQDKIKGSKIVTVEQKATTDFETLEVEDNLEIFLIKGEKCGVEIEADDNLHDIIVINLKDKNLHLSTAKEITSAKKISVRITYTDAFKMVIAKDKSMITALEEINLEEFTLKSFDESKIFVNAKTTTFTLMANDKSKLELNLKSENATIELSKNAQLKALISSLQLTFDMYQKTNAIIEGDATNLKLRLDNNADFTGKNLTATNAEIITEGYSNCNILVNTAATIEASGKSEIQLFGDPKIDLKKFAESAILYKKPFK